MQVKVIVFDGPPQPFNEDVVLASAAAVQADSDFVVFENLGEPVAGKLGALIRVEDFGLAVEFQCLLEGLIAEIRARVLETRQERILRLCQSMTATRYINPLNHQDTSNQPKKLLSLVLELPGFHVHFTFVGLLRNRNGDIPTDP